MLDYMRSLFESVSTVQEQLAIRTEKNYSRTIYIDDCGIEATDFDIQPGDERHRMLIDSGSGQPESSLNPGQNGLSFSHSLGSALDGRSKPVYLHTTVKH